MHLTETSQKSTEDHVSTGVFLSVVIPVFNEHRRISESLECLKTFLSEKTYLCELIIVDDGSSDDTACIVENALRDFPNSRLLKSEKNCGKGDAVKQGMLAAHGEYILFTDADLSISLDEIERFFPFFEEGYDVVIGSRRTEGTSAERNRSIYRQIMGWGMSLLTNTWLLRGLNDTQCGFKCFTKKAAQEIFQLQTINGFAFDVEVLHIAQKKKYRIKQVGIAWCDRPWSSVRLLIDPLKMVRDLVRIHLHEIMGRYS